MSHTHTHTNHLEDNLSVTIYRNLVSHKKIRTKLRWTKKEKYLDDSCWLLNVKNDYTLGRSIKQHTNKQNIRLYRFIESKNTGFIV